MNAAGYIAFDNKGIIHGTGETPKAAWTDAFNTMGQEANHLTTMPATSSLLSLVNTQGGAVGWRRSKDDIACCPGEAEVEDDEDRKDEDGAA